jgi:hypothetical protein
VRVCVAGVEDEGARFALACEGACGADGEAQGWVGHCCAALIQMLPLGSGVGCAGGDVVVRKQMSIRKRDGKPCGKIPG